MFFGFNPEYGGSGGITFDFLRQVYGAVQKTTDLTLEARIHDKQTPKDPAGIPDFVS